MASKIILFVSIISKTSSEREFQCPDGSYVSGFQTNEAPVTYLLKTHPEIQQLLCIVTQDASQSGWPRFSETIHSRFPNVEFVNIPFPKPEEKTEEDAFLDGPLPQIMENLTAGDTVWLETTGGTRNAMLHLTLLTRILSSVGVEAKGCVYGSLNFNPPRIIDVTHVFRLFDMVEGMQDLTAFGNVAALRQYYSSRKPDRRIENLLTATERLEETINLCRSNSVPERLKAFNQALEEADECDDPLLKRLLPAFQSKFGETLTIPSLIRWCLSSNKLQQALTIYTERIPAYLFAPETGFFTAVADAPEDGKDYRDAAARSLEFYLLSHVRNHAKRNRHYVKAFRKLLDQWKGNAEALFSDESNIQDATLSRALSQVREVAMLAYPGDGLRKDPDWTRRLPPELKALAEFDTLASANNRNGFLNQCASVPDRELSRLLKLPLPSNANQWAANDSSELQRRLEAALRENGFRITCSVSRLKTILRDYLFCKALRNMMNHANDTPTENACLYLASVGYPLIDRINSKIITEQLYRCLDHLQPPAGNAAPGQNG